ncbi:unnamed protein product [Triticum aestivum]|uniref:(bread wheat) hypothetical protein n=1 Tax=Triticum aestivum TaxID=4565 RepID=A0A7G2IH62_WHEAT|nr:unnamed protein product [Triticum aestivum]
MTPGNNEFASFGCCVAIEDSVASHREARICHLLTGKRVRLPDPRIGYEGIIFAGNLVLTFSQYHHSLHYCRIGDNHWREARCDAGYRLRDLIFLKGTLYALIFPNFRLAVVELDNSSVSDAVSYCSLSLSTMHSDETAKLTDDVKCFAVYRPSSQTTKSIIFAVNCQYGQTEKTQTLPSVVLSPVGKMARLCHLGFVVQWAKLHTLPSG